MLLWRQPKGDRIPAKIPKRIIPGSSKRGVARSYYIPGQSDFSPHRNSPAMIYRNLKFNKLFKKALSRTSPGVIFRGSAYPRVMHARITILFCKREPNPNQPIQMQFVAKIYHIKGSSTAKSFTAIVVFDTILHTPDSLVVKHTLGVRPRVQSPLRSKSPVQPLEYMNHLETFISMRLLIGIRRQCLRKHPIKKEQFIFSVPDATGTWDLTGRSFF